MACIIAWQCITVSEFNRPVAMVLSAHSILTIATKFGLTYVLHVMGIGLAVGPPTGLSGALWRPATSREETKSFYEKFHYNSDPAVPSINLVVPTSSNATDRIKMALSCCFLFLGFEKVTAEIADGPVNERRQSFTVRFIIVNQIDEKMWRTCLSSKSHFPSCHFSSCFPTLGDSIT